MEPKFVGKSKLTKQGQLTMPNEARQDLKINPNSELFWYELNGSLIVVKEILNPRDLLNFVLKRKKK